MCYKMVQKKRKNINADRAQELDDLNRYTRRVHVRLFVRNTSEIQLQSTFVTTTSNLLYYCKRTVPFNYNIRISYVHTHTHEYR